MNGEKYLHSINLLDGLACHNWSLPSARLSVIASNNLAFNTVIATPHYSCDPEDLYLNPEKCFGGTGSNNIHTIWMASVIRRGDQLIDGYYRPVILSETREKAIIFKADLEIALEKVRRDKYDYKPSRLSSIYLVDDDEDGRWCLNQMFSESVNLGKYKPAILNIRVLFTYSFHKGDIQWLDQYAENKDIANLGNYWQGVQFNNQPNYEYFLEGIIIPTIRSQIENIRENGKRIDPNWDPTPYWKDLGADEYKSWFDK